MINYEELAQKRCKNHPDREAVARCPECTGFFCRECITEHDDRVLCTTCLKKILQQQSLQFSHLKFPVLILQFCVGFCVIWAFFYVLGHMLLLIPSSFHEGTFWQGKW